MTDNSSIGENILFWNNSLNCALQSILRNDRQCLLKYSQLSNLILWRTCTVFIDELGLTMLLLILFITFPLNKKYCLSACLNNPKMYILLVGVKILDICLSHNSKKQSVAQEKKSWCCSTEVNKMQFSCQNTHGSSFPKQTVTIFL